MMRRSAASSHTSAPALCLPQVLLNVLLDRDPAIISHSAEDVNSLKDAAILLRIRLIRATVLPDFDGPRKMPVHGTRNTTGSRAACCYIQLQETA